MKVVSIFFVVLALGCVFPALAEDDVDEKDVLVLTGANYDEERGKHDFMLIEFYAPW